VYDDLYNDVDINDIVMSEQDDDECRIQLFTFSCFILNLFVTVLSVMF